MAHIHTHRFVRSLALSTASLVFLSGCASGPARVHAERAAVPEQTQYTGDASEPANELVIGTAFSEESVPVYRDPIKSYTMGEIRDELEAMADLDRTLIRQTTGEHAHDPSTVSTIHAIDRVESARLKEIVDYIGWPTRAMVGLKATQAAYMVIQHAGHDIDFQNRSLAMMVDLVEQDQLPASYVALLTDRIRMFQNQPQLFGTQMAIAPDEFGMMVPMPTVPIEDPEHLDDRRALMGMPPYREFVGAIAAAYEASKLDTGKAFAEVPTSD